MCKACVNEYLTKIVYHQTIFISSAICDSHEFHLLHLFLSLSLAVSITQLPYVGVAPAQNPFLGQRSEHVGATVRVIKSLGFCVRSFVRACSAFAEMLSHRSLTSMRKCETIVYQHLLPLAGCCLLLTCVPNATHSTHTQTQTHTRARASVRATLLT